MKRAIKRAIEGGYNKGNWPYVILKERLLYGVLVPYVAMGDKEDDWVYFEVTDLLLDPLFWSALGKAEELDGSTYSWQKEGEDKWVTLMHLFIDHIIGGGTPDSFFEGLLTKDK